VWEKARKEKLQESLHPEPFLGGKLGGGREKGTSGKSSIRKSSKGKEDPKLATSSAESIEKHGRKREKKRGH